MHENDVNTTLMKVENVIIKRFCCEIVLIGFLQIYISLGKSSFIATFQPSTFKLEKKSREPLCVKFRDQKCQSFLKFIYDIEERIRENFWEQIADKSLNSFFCTQ